MALLVLQMHGSCLWLNRLVNGDPNAFSKAYLLASKDLKTQPIDGKGWNDGLGF